MTVRQLSGTALGEQVGKPVKTAQNKYVIAELPAPASYQLSFIAKGYAPTTVRVDVGGGTRRLRPTTALRAGDGSISRHGHRRRDPARRDHRDHNGAG